MRSRVPGQTHLPSSKVRGTVALWTKWVLATGLGWTIGGPLALALGGMAGYALLILYYPIWILALVPVAILQWLILRRRLVRAGWWVLATLAAAPIAGTLAIPIVISLSLAEVEWLVRLFGWPAVRALLRAVTSGSVFAALGLVASGPQWLVLRGQVPRAGWWLLASAAGGFLGGLPVGLVFEYAVSVSWEAYWDIIPRSMSGFAPAGLLIGATTGMAMARLLSHAKHGETAGTHHA